MRSASMPSRRPGVACRGGRCWAVWPPERLLPCLAWAGGKPAPSRAAGAAIALAGQKCVHHVCVDTCGPDPFSCSGGTLAGCAGGCACTKKRGGGGVCIDIQGTDCDTAQGCTKQRQCPKGQICATACCGLPTDPKFVCVSPCFA